MKRDEAIVRAELAEALATYQVQRAAEQMRAGARDLRDFEVATTGTRVERMTERRLRARRRIRRAVAIAAAVGTGLVGTTAASAYFTAHGTGSGSASTGTLQAVTASGAAVSNLIPDGTSQDVTLTVTNPNSFAVELTSVTGNGPIAAANGCSPTGVTFADQTGLSQSIPGGNVPTPVTLSAAAAMDSTSASTCQGTTFTIPVTISVHK